MKKAVFLLLALTALISLAACARTDSAGTQPVTQPATQTPTTPPTDCPHSWIAATCTSPKTCTMCGVTEGASAAHLFSAGVCDFCGALSFDGNIWEAKIVRPEGYAESDEGTVLSVISLGATDFQGYTHKDFYSNPQHEEDHFGELIHEGVTYYDYWFSSNMNGILYTDNGDTVTVELMNYTGTLTLQRTSATQFVVTASQLSDFIPVDTVFHCNIEK